MPGRRRRPVRLAGAAAGLLALTLVGALVIPAGASGTGRPAPKVSPKYTLQKAMSALVGAKDGPPGIVVVLANGPHVQVRTAGVSDVVTGRGLQGNNYMRVASVAKAFNGATALSLVAKGKLKLTDTIGRWLPALPASWHAVTLAELLGHTSGIPDFSQTSAFRNALLANLQNPPPHRQLLSYVAGKKPTFTPGSQYKYSNSDNIIAALMVEAATKKSYEQELARNVLGPLHLFRTSLPNGSALPFPSIHGYDDVATPAPTDVTSIVAAGWSWASGGVVSTPADAMKFVRAYVRGALVNRATRTAQFTFRPGSSEPPGPGTNSAGLALFRYQTSCGTFYGHTGNTAGYTQFIASSAGGTRAAVVSINAQITPGTNPTRFAALRHIFELAVCATA